jgi:hypothetical protein
MLRGPFLRALGTGVLAFAAVVLTHGLTYAGLEPAAVLREAWLAASGHGYLPAAGALAFAIAVGATGVVFTAGAAGRILTFRSRFPRLLALQSAGLVALEVAERAASGAGMADLGTVLPVGLVVGSGVAAVIAWATVAMGRVGNRVASAASAARPPRRRALAWALPPSLLAAGAPASPVSRGRAPPPSPG